MSSLPLGRPALGCWGSLRPLPATPPPPAATPPSGPRSKPGRAPRGPSEPGPAGDPSPNPAAARSVSLIQRLAVVHQREASYGDHPSLKKQTNNDNKNHKSKHNPYKQTKKKGKIKTKQQNKQTNINPCGGTCPESSHQKYDQCGNGSFQCPEGKHLCVINKNKMVIEGLMPRLYRPPAFSRLSLIPSVLP